MQRMRPSDVRRRWFSVLDRVAAGEVVAVERHGHLVVLRRESSEPGRAKVPDYRRIIRVPGADDADRWHWKWSAKGGQLELRARRA